MRLVGEQAPATEAKESRALSRQQTEGCKANTVVPQPAETEQDRSDW
jgi:hypothetical protein